MAECNEEEGGLEVEFERAADRLTTLVSTLDSEKLLFFYARFKQAKEGPCNIPKPGFFNFQAKQKWEAWRSLGQMSRQQAMQEYVEEITILDPSWAEIKDESNLVKKSGLGLAVSTLRSPDFEILNDAQKTIFEWVKEGNADRVNDLLFNQDANQLDEEGMTLLHWACDRGYPEVVEVLLKHGVNINKQDAVGQTALHYASSCGHATTVQLLLSKGADASVKDDDGMTPYEVACDSNIASLIKR